MRALSLLARSVLFAWAALSVLLALFIWRWMRERYGRGGPMPASQALLLLNPRRARLHPVGETLRTFRITRGDTVLELGPGPGYFSAEAARIAGPRGRIVCVDVQPAMIAILRRRLDEQGAANAQPLAGDATALPLAAHSVDAAFLVTVLGEVPDRPRALGELRRVLKPGGVLSIMETLTDPDYMLEASVRDLCRAYGFSELDLKRQRLGYVLVFAAPAAQAGGL